MKKNGKFQKALLFNDLISGIMFLSGSILFSIGSFSAGILLFIIGSAEMIITPAYRLIKEEGKN